MEDKLLNRMEVKVENEEEDWRLHPNVKLRVILRRLEDATPISEIQRLGTEDRTPNEEAPTIENSDHVNSNSKTDFKRMPCFFCKVIFPSTWALGKHYETHKVNNVYKCNLCWKTAKYVPNLKSHIRSHSEDNKFKCKFCNMAFTGKSQLKAHQESHVTENPYSCLICKMKFPSKECLTKHEVAHVGNEEYTCDNCQAKFPTVNELFKHVQTHLKTKLLECGKCSMLFSLRKMYERHCKRHLENDFFNCMFCEGQFSTFKILNEHIRQIHAGEKYFPCEICRKTFSDMGKFRLHEQIHLNQIVFCPTCKKVFIGSAAKVSHNFESHLKSHTQEKTHFCGFCNKGFSSESNLILHIRTHTGEKPYSCHLCPKSFAGSSNLKDHIRRHSRQKPYKCTLCEKCFKSNECLKLHKIRKHGLHERNFKCDACSKTFYSRGQLCVSVKDHTLAKFVERRSHSMEV